MNPDGNNTILEMGDSIVSQSQGQNSNFITKSPSNKNNNQIN